jgi:hypothetical protein
MAGPVPAIHVFLAAGQGVDGRNKSGHDVLSVSRAHLQRRNDPRLPATSASYDEVLSIGGLVARMSARDTQVRRSLHSASLHAGYERVATIFQTATDKFFDCRILV